MKFLAKISVNIDIKTSEVSFSLPDFGLGFKDTIIENDVWDSCKDDLVKGREIWGMVGLGYRSPDDFDFTFEYERKSSKAKNSKDGKIKLVSFKNFCPYEIDLEVYKEARKEFTTDEWIDVILGAVDYNAAGYETEEEKLTMLTRLLPFVEKRLNLIELAPKGTGKSYLFGNVSRYGETILHRMDLIGISISTGSACDSVNTEISHVLKAIQLDEDYATGTIRISLGKNNTEEDVKAIASSLIKIVAL